MTSWVKVSILQPDFTMASPFAGAGRQVLFLFEAIGAITLHAVQWRLASRLVNLQVTGFFVRERVSVAWLKTLLKPSVCSSCGGRESAWMQGWRKVFFLVALKGAWWRPKEVEEASALPSKEATNAQLQRNVFFSKRAKYERRARFAHVSC